MPEQPPKQQPSPILPILAAIAAVAIILTLVYVGSRLETIEDQLTFQQPQTSSHQVAVLPITSAGRSVYVPAYSHIYSKGGQAFLLEITLSIRNTDPELPVRIDRVSYYDTQGRKLRELVDSPLTLAPLQTAAYLVPKSDVEGGSGANFIVKWSAQKAVNQPVMETVMIGTDKDYNLSFTSRGIPLQRAAP